MVHGLLVYVIIRVLSMYSLVVMVLINLTFLELLVLKVVNGIVLKLMVCITMPLCFLMMMAENILSMEVV
eukprot:jgi/Orpsp1_1/1191782/evm.model.d7180000088485.1